MIILGLTGSIGMGKSTVAAQFATCGALVLNADLVAHQLMSPRGAAFSAVAEAFPQAVESGHINRQKLGKIVFGDDAALAQLEAIMHPQIMAARADKAHEYTYRRHPLVVMEVPLLYEIGADTLCDVTVVVTAPAFIQRQRVLKRKGMTPEKFQQILARQLPDIEKRLRADAVIHTGLGKAQSMQQVRALLRQPYSQIT